MKSVIGVTRVGSRARALARPHPDAVTGWVPDPISASGPSPVLDAAASGLSRTDRPPHI